MKKIISLILLITVITAVCNVGYAVDAENTGAEGVVMTAEATAGRPGETLTVTLSLTSNPGFMYMRFTPRYDASVLTLKSISHENAEVVYDSAVADKNVVIDNGTDITGTGTFLTLTFEIATGAVPGPTNIGFEIRECYNENEDDVAFTSASVEAQIVLMRVTIGSGEGVLDGTVELTVTIENNPGFCYMEIKPVIPEFMSVKKITAKNENVKCSKGNLLLIESKSNGDFTGNGLVATVTFYIDEHAPRGTYDIGAQMMDIYNWDEDEVDAMPAVGGSVTVTCDHHRTEIRNALDPNCTESGYSGDTYCSLCGDLLREGETVAPNGHSYGEPAFEWNDGLTAATAKFVCSACGDIQTVTATVSVETRDATCTEAGEIKYTATALFEGVTYTDEKTTATDPKGHKYGEPTFEWAEDHSAATAKFVCSECEDIQTVRATVTVETRDATCTEAGESKYTATAVFEGVTYIDEKTVTIEPKGHKYGEPAFEWAEDHTAATAKFVCSKCEDVQTVEATVVEYRAEPSCTEKGLLRYTATAEFEGTTYTDTVSFELEAKGHSYGAVFEWSEDCKSATVTVTCSSCGDTHTMEAAVAEEVKTVREDGKAANVSVFSATAEFEGETYTEKKEVVNFLYGDVNGDGEVNGRDLIRLRKYLNGENVVICAGANVNGSADGLIDGKDLIRFRKYLANPDLSLLGPN